MADTDGFRYALGSKVRDKITGYEGMLHSRTEWLYGCRRYLIQAAQLKPDGSPVESFAVDEDAVELLEAVADVPAKFAYELGSRARDKITGYEGLIHARSEWLYGPVRYNFQSQAMKDGAPASQHGVFEAGIELIVEAEPHKMKKSGGPSGVASRPVDVRR